MKYALLIDSENARPALDEIFLEISKYGDTPIRLLIGDFTNPERKNWISLCQKYAISCVQTMNFTSGKNSLDISLVIEGMKILYEKTYIDGIIIVASDSDYTPLCREWRSQGKDVIAIGRANSPESFVRSCTKFIAIENLLGKENKQKDPKVLESLEKIKKSVYEIINSNNGKCQLSLVCETLIKNNASFDTRSYGYSKPIDFFRGEFKDIYISEDIKNTYFLNLNENKIEKPILEKKENSKKAAKRSNNNKLNNKKKNTKKNDKPMKLNIIREEVNDDLDLD